MAASGTIQYSVEELKGISMETCFVPTMFFSHEMYKPKDPPMWHDLLEKKVISCWIAARERTMDVSFEYYIEDRNDWVIVLETSNERTVTIELQVADETGNTITICRPGPPIRIVNYQPTSGFEPVEGYAASFKTDVTVHVKVQDWLDQLEKSGVTRYRLLNDRGRRHWVWSAIRQFQSFLACSVLPAVARSHMMNIWEHWEKVETQGPGEQEDVFYVGMFLPVKWPKPLTPSPPSPSDRTTATPLPTTSIPATPVPATPVPATPVPATPVPATPVPATPSAPTPYPVTPQRGNRAEADSSWNEGNSSWNEGNSSWHEDNLPQPNWGNSPEQYESNRPQRYGSNRPQRYGSSRPQQHGNNRTQQYESNRPQRYENNRPRGRSNSSRYGTRLARSARPHHEH
ncbi:hypothetical protein F5B20DRAFT_583298 [Whalleya microplaca]|nr:hypothetical protein F5B20DRAFT_583298 [Whalleya microplaca]